MRTLRLALALFAAAIASLEDRREERMPPLVHVALRQQAERIERLETDLRELRGTVEGDPRRPS